MSAAMVVAEHPRSFAIWVLVWSNSVLSMNTSRFLSSASPLFVIFFDYLNRSNNVSLAATGSSLNFCSVMLDMLIDFGSF